MNKEPISTVAGNTPVKNVPSDYYPPGCGFWFKLTSGPDEGKKMFFRDSTHGHGKPDNTVVFVHGNPESSYIYRRVIEAIHRTSISPYRIVAMDHIGFGLSDQADFQMVSMDHAENLLQLIRYLDLQNVTLVIHDWGGPIGIGAFLQEPERVSNLVVTNSTVFPIPETGLNYTNYPIKHLPWSFYPRMIPDALWGSFAAYAVYKGPSGALSLIGGLIKNLILFELGIFPEENKKAMMLFKEQFKTAANAKSSKRLVRQTPYWGWGNTYVEPNMGKRDTTSFYRYIHENISRFWGPQGRNIGARIVCGRWDPLGEDGVLDQWRSHLPQLAGNITVFDNIGHFIEEVKYKEIAEAITELMGRK